MAITRNLRFIRVLRSYTTAADLKSIAFKSKFKDENLTVQEKIIRDEISTEMSQLAHDGSVNVMRSLRLNTKFHGTLIKEFERKNFNVISYVSEKDHLHIHLRWDKNNQDTYSYRTTNMSFFWWTLVSGFVIGGVCAPIWICDY